MGLNSVCNRNLVQVLWLIKSVRFAMMEFCPQGPVLPVEHSVDPGLEDRTFIEETCLTLVETDGPASCEQLIREVVRRFPISWACCRQSLPSWKRRSRTKMFQFWLVIDKIFVRFFLSCSALNLGLFFMILAFSQRGLPWI